MSKTNQIQFNPIDEQTIKEFQLQQEASSEE